MSDYTPTTEEVRDAFAIRKWDNFQRNYPNSHDKAERDAERERFRRWLAEEVRKAKAGAWEEGHSWGWSDAQEAHDVSQRMDRADWDLSMPNPYRDQENQ